MLTTTVVYRLASQGSQTSVATMLLAGIAINALAGAGTGLFTFVATDAQLRTMTFWSLGSLGAATWSALLAAAPFLLATSETILTAFTLPVHVLPHPSLPCPLVVPAASSTPVPHMDLPGS
jgi:ABC-type Fe3+-siderophore transport system permease subunit